ncbi:hypothetical protein N474_21295 [Pseudoalteromonas luteoviolacea CPMOR-2]|uniref:Uncharacterized protein n=1 Tax=Pseudoalteromonas luteoviolacea DSM 6061 TaxID=1365250 RepID=A0A166U967_9GAMM|nr:hypothetical protein [Pseudoalteromonas luteoviolacea]KZN29689.1 hypothetical protein N475_05170 [Pseudoalteromonas luteoviolacea DSM 6061]KZN53248.1 hypothetical protein N474_21295 [Pseudoalteromonas luteoviolacea CPMOR-2]MBE0389421.1 hypothetical protein [Pseudoalteromonas luteoviolacea DSM 6061]
MNECQERQVQLMNAMYNEVKEMREADWLAEPAYGCEGTLAQEKTKVEKYEAFRNELLEINPDYLKSELSIVNQYGETLSFVQAQDIINIKIEAFKSGNEKRHLEKLKALALQRENHTRLMQQQEKANAHQNQLNLVSELKQQLAPWRSVGTEQDVDESSMQKHERLQALAEEHQFKTYIDSFKEVYQALIAGTELAELEKYALIPEQDHQLYSLLCLVGKYAIFQGVERNSAPNSNFSRLIAVEIDSTIYYERFSTLKKAVYAIKGTRRFAVKIATDQNFQIQDAEQEILIYKYISNY